MCGIAGKVTGGAPVEPALLHRMCDAIEHRGPDAEGVHLDGPVALGMRRLAVNDLSPDGEQPLRSEDGRFVLVGNGEVYNHHELRDGLRARGHTFVGGSDLEVVVHLWEERGPAAVELLRGMWALAIWDAVERELHLVRDRVGKKPLYWTQRGDTLWFGSEPRSILLDPEVPCEMDLAGVDAFLVNQYVPHDRCAFAGLHKLPPASVLRWRPGTAAPEVRRYWTLDRTPDTSLTAADARGRLRELVLEATRLRLTADVPLGAFLSGGVDSGLVVAAMAQASPTPVRTFCAGFADEDFDERPYARMVAERYGTDHHELVIDPPTPELLPRLAWHFGEPFADPAALPTFQLAELTRSHVTVALNGDGGDEGFGGYKRYRQLWRTEPAERVPVGVRRAVAAGLGAMARDRDGRGPVDRSARLARRLALHPARRYADLFRYLDEGHRRELYGPRMREAAAGSDPLRHVVREWDALPADLPWPERAMAVDARTYLSDDLVAKVDIAAMAWGLEVRSPLLDQEVLAFAARVPLGLKVDRGSGKHLLRDVAREWLPDALLDRPKFGFGVPVDRWLRGPLRTFAHDVLLDPSTTARGLLDPEGVRGLLAQHDAGTPHGQRIWALLALELWLRTCVDQVTATPPGLPVAA